MKILIVIKCCHKYQVRAQACRDTWLADLPPGTDYKFFYGRGPGEPKPDEVFLDVDDHYFALPAKSQAICKWGAERDYDYIFFCDDDTYVVVDRLLVAVPVGKDYVGRLRGPSGNWPAPYCSGFAYWLSKRAASIVAETTLYLDPVDDRMIGNMLMKHNVRANFDPRFVVSQDLGARKDPGKGIKDVCEDRAAGNVLDKAGIKPTLDVRYAVVRSQRNGLSSWSEPGPDNHLIAVCEFEPAGMRELHARVVNRFSKSFEPASGPAAVKSDIAVMVKTFLRDGFLFKALCGIDKSLPDAKIVVVDDGYEDRAKIILAARLREKGHAWVNMPFDTGFSRKSNAAIEHLDRKYVLIGSDDFDFGAPNVAGDIAKMRWVLEQDQTVGFAGGRVNGIPYEWQWELAPSTIKEYKGYAGGGPGYSYCDLTVNYGLVRRKVLDKVRWDDTGIKIGGGEHSAWFWDLKQAGWKAAYVHDTNINELRGLMMDRRYPLFRQRARQPGRPLLKARGIDTYTMGDGTVEQS